MEPLIPVSRLCMTRLLGEAEDLGLCLTIWDHEISRIAELLTLNVRTALNLAIGGLKDFSGGFENAELSVILCNDECMRKHNKEWRDEDRAPGVVSKSKHLPGLKIPNVVLGDIVISVEMVARQAEQRGYTLLDEMRLLMVVLAEALICVLLHEITFFIELFGPATKFEALLVNSSWKLELKGAVLLVFANKQWERRGKEAYPKKIWMW